MRTFGELKLYNGHWLLTGEPHMIAKAKRVFGKVDTSVPGRAALIDSTENCRDLLWFMDRYPLDVHDNHLRALKRGAKKYTDNVLFLDDLFSGRTPPQDFELAIPPRSYQKVAATSLLRAKALLLGDDLGVGKTASAICALSSKETRPAVVVTLSHTTRQWQNEISRFAPNLHSHVAKLSTPYDLKVKGEPEPDVLIMNYHKLHGWADTIVKKRLARMVVFDEIQELRRNESQKYTAARMVADAATFRLGLSGTPIYGYGSEMYNVLSILQHDVLGSREEFMREWCASDSVKDPRAFGSYLRERGIFLRRTRKEVGRELPPVTRVSYAIDADQEALEGIQSSATNLARIIMSHKKNEAFVAAGEFDAMMRHATGVAKAPFVADFVRLLLESGESVVLFGWHHDVYNIWRDRLNQFNPVFFTGTESANQKELSKQLFVSGKSKLLIMSLRAGAGLDGLQHVCRTVVVGELDWASGVLEQCLGRVARDGQADPVTAYFLISDSGADPVMADVLGIKEQQLLGIRDPNAPLLEQIQAPEDRIKKLAESYLAKAKSEEIWEPF